MPIIATDEFDTFLGCAIEGQFTAGQKKQAVDAINAAALRTMKRKALYFEGVEYVKGLGLTEKLWLKWPIVSIEEVFEDYSGGWGQIANTFAANSELTIGEHWVRDPDHNKSPLIRIDGCCWSDVPGSIKVNYAYGWEDADVPADMKQACLRLAAIMLQMRTRQGMLQSETFGKYSYTLLQPGGNTGDTTFDSDLIGIRRTLNAYALEAI